MGLFGRGYEPFHEKAERRSKYLMSCFNCEYYYQAVGDSEELCQNTEVLEYDMINTESSIYCLLWTPVKIKPKASKTGFKNGVSLRGRKKTVTKTRKTSGKRNRR